MKKNGILWVSMLLMMMVGVALICLTFASCGDPDDSKGETKVEWHANPKNPDNVPNGTYIDFQGYVIDGLFYLIDPSNNTAIFNSSYDRSLTNITIPQQIEVDGKQYTVESISEHAFDNMELLVSVVLPGTITTIGAHAFQDCINLTSINLPDNLKSIMSRAFANCRALTTITLPKNLVNIGSEAFEDCSHIESISLPNTLTSIGDRAFKGCNTLTSIVIPQSVSRIGEEAFSGCKSITTIVDHSHVLSSGDTFAGCESITSLTISPSYLVGRFGTQLTELNLGEGVETICNAAFSNCTKLTSVKLPNSVVCIGERAFYGCSSLTSITLPKKLLTMDIWAFANSNLKEVTCLAVTPPHVPQEVNEKYSPLFSQETEENGTLYVPAASVDAYKSTYGWKGFKNIVGI